MWNFISYWHKSLRYLLWIVIVIVVELSSSRGFIHIYTYVYVFACLSVIWYFTCDLLYDLRFTIDDWRFTVCLNNFMPIEPHDTGRNFNWIRIEKCRKMQRIIIIGIIYCHSKWRKDIFMGYSIDKHSCHISYWNLFVWKCTWVNSLEPIWSNTRGVGRQWRTVATLLANVKQFFAKMYLIVVQRDKNKRKCLPNWNRCFAANTHTHTHTHTHTAPHS